MKKFHWLSIFVFAGFLLLYSCKKNDSTNTPKVANNTIPMAATINDIPWSANTVQGLDVSGTLILIGTKSSDGSNLLLVMPTNILPGSYTVSSSNGTYSAYYNTQNIQDYISYGVLVISSNANNTISGTFQGTLSDINQTSSNSLTLTTGVFTIKYSASIPSMSATFNGVNWVANVVSSTNNGNLEIKGSDSSTTGANWNGFFIDIPPNIKPGSYLLNQPSFLYDIDYHTNKGYFGMSGSINIITNINNIILGTFSGSYEDNSGINVPVSRGYFLAKY